MCMYTGRLMNLPWTQMKGMKALKDDNLTTTVQISLCAASTLRVSYTKWVQPWIFRSPLSAFPNLRTLPKLSLKHLVALFHVEAFGKEVHGHLFVGGALMINHSRLRKVESPQTFTGILVNGLLSFRRLHMSFKDKNYVTKNSMNCKANLVRQSQPKICMYHFETAKVGANIQRNICI